MSTAPIPPEKIQIAKRPGIEEVTHGPGDKKTQFPTGWVLAMAGVGLHWRQRLRETVASIHIETSQETFTNLRNTF